MPDGGKEPYRSKAGYRHLVRHSRARRRLHSSLTLGVQGSFKGHRDCVNYIQVPSRLGQLGLGRPGTGPAPEDPAHGS
jgi:hypothetical protein